jgi:hypothetical protein
MADALQILFGAPADVEVSTQIYSSAQNFSVDGSADRVGMIFQAETADQITAVGFRHASLTGTPPTYKVSIQGVAAANRFPDGTIKGGGTPASATFTPTAGGGYGSGTWHWISLDNAYTPSRGELLAIVIEYNSGTINGSNFSAFSYGAGATSGRHMPYAVTDSGAGWASSAGSQILIGGIKGAAVIPVAGMLPLETLGAVSSLAGTTEAGFAFTVPSGWADTFQVLGARMKMRGLSTGQSWVMTLYSSPTSSPSVLQQITFDSDNANAWANTVGRFDAVFDEASLSSLTAGTEYGIGFVGINTTVDLGIYTLEVDAGGDFVGWPFGQNVTYIERTLSTGFTGPGTEPNESTNFSKTTTKRVLGELILADITEPSGGGSGGVTRARLPSGLGVMG